MGDDRNRKVRSVNISLQQRQKMLIKKCVGASTHRFFRLDGYKAWLVLQLGLYVCPSFPFQISKVLLHQSAQLFELWHCPRKFNVILWRQLSLLDQAGGFDSALKV